MSFLNELRYSLENEDVLGDNTPVTVEEEAEADVAAAEAEVVRQEIENNVQQVERAEAVVDELELTNDALAGAVAQSEDGTIPVETAAMVEAQRRTAAVALNLDPEQGAGADLVDNPGLESLVKGGVSLEEATSKTKEVISKIVNFINEIGRKIKEGLKKFATFIGKIFNVLPRQLKEAAGVLKTMDGKDINERLQGVDKELKLAVGTPTKVAATTDFKNGLGMVIAALTKGNTNIQGQFKDTVFKAGNTMITIEDPATGKFKFEPAIPHEVTGDELKSLINDAFKNIDVVKSMDSAFNAFTSKVAGAEWKVLGFDFNNASVEEANKVRAFALTVSRYVTLTQKWESGILTQLRNAVKLVKAISKETKTEEEAK